MKKYIPAEVPAFMFFFALYLFSFNPAFSQSNKSSVLYSYVESNDGMFKWEKVSQTDFKEKYNEYEIKLTSQVWHGIIWGHTLSIIVPKKIKKDSTLALLIIAGSGKGAIQLGEVLAEKIDAPVAVLNDVPNQPLFGGLKEDKLIAETFVRFKETGDSTWPLLLPMTKSAVKAMDAVEEFMKDQFGIQVSGFVVTGGSKRGWTTWLTSVVDRRVKAIAPMVYDNLNLREQMIHQLDTWGKFSEQISDYTERNIPQLAISDEKFVRELSGIVDPYAYRDDIIVPKLMIMGTNDRYWTLDALNLYYKRLSGEKYLFYVPNAGHDLKAGFHEVINDIAAFFLKTEGRLQFTELTWELMEKNGNVMISVSSTIKPVTIRAWVATSPTKDFRDSHWESFDMEEKGNVYTYTIRKPDAAHVAILGEAVYSENGVKYSLSTNVNIFK